MHTGQAAYAPRAPPLVQNGASPVFIASLRGHVDALRVLIEAKADVDAAMKVHSVAHVLAGDVFVMCL